MKIARFFYKKDVFWGVVEKEQITLLSGEPYAGIKKTFQKVKVSDVEFLAPVTPTKVICAGLNYRDHAKELKMNVPVEPIIFIKPASAVIAHNQSIVYPPKVTRLDYEAELAIVISKSCRNISEKQASKCILGYTCLNDVTARDLQEKDGQWTRAKSFDTFCPIGPWIETKLDPHNLRIQLFLNGVMKQDSLTSNFIFSVEHLVSFSSYVMTLNPGDVISTGTAPGVGPMHQGDCVEVVIEKIGKLTNSVIYSPK